MELLTDTSIGIATFPLNVSLFMVGKNVVCVCLSLSFKIMLFSGAGRILTSRPILLFDLYDLLITVTYLCHICILLQQSVRFTVKAATHS